MKKISYVIPVHNEEQGIANFLDKHLMPVIKNIKKYDYEIVLVDDGSTDNSLQILQEYSVDKRIKIISFSRNFGKEAALAAGLKTASGEAAIMLDADGQHPPKLIPEFIEKWENGADVVTGIRQHYTKHGLVKKAGSKIFYKLFSLMGNKTTVPGSTDYRLLGRIVIDEFNKLTEHNRITRGLIDWLGFKQDVVKYNSSERIAGKPTYTFKKLFNLAVDSFVSMSTTPLVIFGYVGVFITVASFLLGMFVIIQQHLLGDPLGLQWNGAIQMAIFITFLVGLVLISQAITALYISHIHAESKGRPLYIVDAKSSKNL